MQLIRAMELWLYVMMVLFGINIGQKIARVSGVKSTMFLKTNMNNHQSQRRNDMCFYDLEYPQFYVSKIRRARKVHKCDECFKEIRATEQYEHVTGKWYDDVEVYKTCGDCLNLRNRIYDIEISRGCSSSEATPGHGQLMDIINDYPELKEQPPEAKEK